MSVESGTNISDSGLIFYYDVINSKSFKGKPTVNTCGFGTYDYGYNSTKISNATPPVPPPITGYPIYKITSNDGNDSQQILYTASVDQVNGGTYTHSAYVYLESGTWVSAGQHWNPWDYGTPQYIPRGVWTRIEDPVTNSPNNWGAVALSYNTNGAVYVTASQYELGGFASPFAGGAPTGTGTRSNDKSILDLIGKNTITANSLTYNNDGTFSFNGSSNYMDCGNASEISSITGTSNVTVESWVNLSGYGSSSYGVITHKGYPWAWLMENPNNTMRIRFGLSISGDVSCSDSATHALNTWYHFVGTYDGSNMRFYRNGILTNTVAASGTLGGSGINMIVGSYGGAYFSQGQIPIVRIYNRTLSSEEVAQNFQALRGRFGI